MSASPGRPGGRRFSGLGTQAKRALTARSTEPLATDTVLARARMAKATLTEDYFYKQDISRNRSTNQDKRPIGHVKLVVPYDGDQYFTRSARADVAKAVSRAPATQHAEAQIGHVQFTDYQRTNLGEVLHLNDRYDSVPVRVPISTDGMDGALNHLNTDRWDAVTTYDYQIEPPRELPVAVSVELLDPDSYLSNETGGDLHDQPELIGQHATFQPFLLLSVRVSVTLPNTEEESNHRAPSVRRVSIDWPTITSLAALNLFFGGQKNTDAITYNPLRRCIEWRDVEMPGVAVSENGMTVTYQSKAMLLHIGQPGELYRQRSIAGEVEVEIPGRLLSGTQARLYDGHGRPDRETLTLLSRVHTKLELFLDDAFSRRTMKPYQLLHFDEVIPDRMRFTDIEHALKDRGFTKQDGRSIEMVDGKQFIVADRSAGPATMTLFLYVVGERYETERKKDAGGSTYTSKMESGELKVHMSGELAGDSRLLTHEMNALQRALREKFAHLQSRH